MDWLTAGPPATLGEALWEKALPKLMIKLAIAGILAWVVKTALAAKPREGMLGTGARELAYGRVVALIGGVGLAVALAIIGYALGHDEARGVLIGFGVLLGAAQAALLATALGTAIEYDRSAISARSVWRGDVVLQWTEVTRVSFRSGAGAFRLEAADGRRIDIGMMLEGVGALVAELPELVPPDRCRDALADYARLRSRYHG